MMSIYVLEHVLMHDFQKHWLKSDYSLVSHDFLDQ